MVADPRIIAEIDPASLAAMLRRIREFPNRLASETRKSLRAAGASVVQDVKDAALAGGGDGGHRLKGKSPEGGTGHMRQGIAAGTHLSIVAGVTRQAVTITTDTRKMAPGRAAMVKAWNKPSFRHPTFKTGVWSEQQGHPYFGAVIGAHRAEFLAAMEAALTKAIKEMEA